jgi:His-Xaa-Ser system protein HxsD
MPSQPAVIQLDPAVYRLSAIKKAAYKFGDRCTIEIDSRQPPGLVRVSLTPKGILDDPSSLAGEFRNEVLDQELREVVAEETGAIRNVLLAQAFSGTALLDPTGEHADPADDPLGIRRGGDVGPDVPGDRQGR